MCGIEDVITTVSRVRAFAFEWSLLAPGDGDRELAGEESLRKRLAGLAKQ